ncbi:MAG: hypothetical protein ACRCX2_36460 [Paraclostridium sp.]|uniref:hypothetical protein n=1 Tax=Cetobacterium sp. TaxID=2071632 RepID=UPI003F2E050C
MFDFNRIETYIKVLKTLGAETIVFGEYQIGIDMTSDDFYFDKYDTEQKCFVPVVEERKIETFKKEVAKHVLNAQEEK